MGRNRAQTFAIVFNMLDPAPISISCVLVNPLGCFSTFIQISYVKLKVYLKGLFVSLSQENENKWILKVPIDGFIII